MQKTKIHSLRRFLAMLALTAGFAALFLMPNFKAFAQEGDPCELTEEGCEEMETFSEVNESSESVSEFATLDEPVVKPVLQLKDESGNEQWQASALETYGIQFVIRAKEALKWSLSIEESGFHNPAIEQTHSKVLTIANSLFILGLLAIAGLWMFSAFLPPKKLKRVMMVYAAAVIFINFALPFNQLLIDGADLLQNSLMTKEDGEITVTDVVQTPDYQEGLVYQRMDETSPLSNAMTDTFYLQSANDQDENVEISEQALGLLIGSIEKTEENVIENINEEGEVEPIELTTTETQAVYLNTDQPLSITQVKPFNPRMEQSLFTFIILIATGLAYFLVALVFILRFVILWGLLILSPLLLLLAIFKSTRGWFVNWLGIYGRWLLIGPLMALGLSIVINIWRVSGLPVEANLISQQIFISQGFSNIAFYLPGRTEANTLSNTTQMMEYIVFLVMLYLPIFFAFALTRQKTINALGSVLVETIRSKEKIDKSTFIKETSHDGQEFNQKETHVKGFMQGIKQNFGQKMERLAEMALPETKGSESGLSKSNKFSSPATFFNISQNPSQPTVSNTLSHPLGEMPEWKKSAHSTESTSTSKTSSMSSSNLVDQWKRTLGGGTMLSHQQMVQSLAFPQNATHEKERSLIHKVRQQVDHYAQQGNQQAISLIGEVKRVQQSNDTYTSNNNMMIQSNIDRRSYFDMRGESGQMNQTNQKKQPISKIPKHLKTKKKKDQKNESSDQQNSQSANSESEPNSGS